MKHAGKLRVDGWRIRHGAGLHARVGTKYRVTHQIVLNRLLISKQKFHFGLARPRQARPKRNFSFEVNRRIVTT